jgi:hypothetical protein
MGTRPDRPGVDLQLVGDRGSTPGLLGLVPFFVNFVFSCPPFFAHVVNSC